MLDVKRFGSRLMRLALYTGAPLWSRKPQLMGLVVVSQSASALSWRKNALLRQTVWSARRLARKLARVAVGSGPAVEPQLREAPVMNEGSCVGLDVHARSVVAGVIDVASGEVRSLRVPPAPRRSMDQHGADPLERRGERMT